jgi:glutathione S-transferase
MKLYYSRSATSFACHLALIEAGIKYELDSVNLKEKVTNSGSDFRQINPKGVIPVLEIEPGKILSECSTILKYILDQTPDRESYQPGSWNRYKLDEILNYIATELHMSYRPLTYVNRITTNPEEAERYKTFVKDLILKKFGYIDQILGKSEYLMGDKISIADYYAWTVLNWAKLTRINFKSLPAVENFYTKIKNRPSVHEAIEKEKQENE